MIWLDAHLSPRLAVWITNYLKFDATAIRDLGLRGAEDENIFDHGRKTGATLLTKDKDFVDIVKRRGSPPKVIWLRCGNTSEERLKELLAEHLGEALDFLDAGEDLVEIR